MDQHDHEALAAELWGDDPEVEITTGPVDANAFHGQNTLDEMSREAKLIPALARFLGWFK